MEELHFWRKDMGTNWERLVSGEELDLAAIPRAKEGVEEKFDASLVAQKEAEGWTIKKTYKNGSALMVHPKKVGDSFEDEVWMIFYKMGFSVMNADRHFKLSYSEEYPNLTKQLDVIAIDDETCLFIECKETERFERGKSWLPEIGEMESKYGGLIREISKEYPGRKFKYIFATKNYVLGSQDRDRLANAKIAYFDDETVSYYKALVEHLGPAARYQLLGNLFAHTTIKGMDEKIPAIEGKMGGYTYYTFLIEPERLLKISYILHRTNANHDLMPTYQRLIKKDRLKKIRQFVDNGGYFPNSLIISIDARNGGLRFDRASQNTSSVSRIGTLYLPKEYQSAYVIDGQHRLYGYSESRFATSNTIPVVAFVNMDKDEQVRMFMDINENQKAVSKSLRNTLIIDLNWDSPELAKRKEAVILHICQKLGEDKDSPLYGRVVTGENTVTERRCITIEYLKNAIEKTSFFNKYKKNTVSEQGVLDRTDSKETADVIYPFIKKCLDTIEQYCHEEWEKGSAGYLTINNMMVAVIRVIGDIVDLIIKKDGLPSVIYDTDDLWHRCEDWIVSLADTINNLPLEKRDEIKTAKGGNAKEVAWRTLQVEFSHKNPEFTNEDLEKYITEYCVDYNPEASDYVSKIKNTIIERIKDTFVQVPNWQVELIPEELAMRVNRDIAGAKVKNQRIGVERDIDFWEMISLDDVCKIACYRTNWTTYLKDILVNPNEQKNRMETLDWLKSISSSESRIGNGKQITRTEFEKIDNIYKWLIKNE